MRAYWTHSSRVWESKVQGLPLVRTFLCASIARRWSLCGRGGRGKHPSKRAAPAFISQEDGEHPYDLSIAVSQVSNP